MNANEPLLLAGVGVNTAFENVPALNGVLFPGVVAASSKFNTYGNVVYGCSWTILIGPIVSFVFTVSPGCAV